MMMKPTVKKMILKTENYGSENNGVEDCERDNMGDRKYYNVNNSENGSAEDRKRYDTEDSEED